MGPVSLVASSALNCPMKHPSTELQIFRCSDRLCGRRWQAPGGAPAQWSQRNAGRSLYGLPAAAPRHRPKACAVRDPVLRAPWRSSLGMPPGGRPTPSSAQSRRGSRSARAPLRQTCIPSRQGAVRASAVARVPPSRSHDRTCGPCLGWPGSSRSGDRAARRYVRQRTAADQFWSDRTLNVEPLERLSRGRNHRANPRCDPH